MDYIIFFCFAKLDTTFREGLPNLFKLTVLKLSDNRERIKLTLSVLNFSDAEPHLNLANTISKLFY